MNICIVLDPGGDPSSTAAMGAHKTLTVDTPFTGLVCIEAKCGSGWVRVPGWSLQNPGSVTIDAMFSEVRVSGAPAGAPSISISAEDDKGAFVDLPIGGTAVDTDALGSENTILVAGMDPGDKAVIQTSEDGVTWADIPGGTFQIDGFKVISVVACFMRVVYSGSGAASVCVGANAGGNFSVSSAVSGIVWRLEATGDDAPGGNVYTIWEDVYAAIEAARVLGPVDLIFDANFSTDGTPPTGNGMMIPEGVWDMTGVTWKSVPLTAFAPILEGGPTIYFEDNAFCDDIEAIALDFGFIWHDGLVHTPMRGNVYFSGGRSECYNTIPGALPMFEPSAAAGPPVWFCTIKDTSIFGNGIGGTFDDEVGLTSPAPLFNMKSFAFCAFTMNGGDYANNIATQDAGFFLFFVNEDGGQGAHQWLQPGLTAWDIALPEGTHGNQTPFAFRGPWVAGDVGSGAGGAPIMAHNTLILLDTSIAAGGDFNVEFPTAARIFGDPVTLKNVGTEGVATCLPVGGGTIESPYLLAGQSKTWFPNRNGIWRLMSEAGLEVRNNFAAAVAPGA
jgi:hypothetical protein